MERRRRGVVAMGAGVVLAVVGELASHVAALAAICAAAATLLLLGGGLAVAMSFREEAGGLPSRSRLAMLAPAGGRRPRGGARASIGGAAQRKAGEAEGRLVAYAHLFNAELESCARLLGGSPSSQEIEAARERLVGLVASPLYGDATRRKLVDEARVREVSGQLARAL
ncbi:MAG TPA: hypothetical protein VKU92_03870 [Acidimicrobiales bacterium]|nr:hypothetical protein [Acidimicrobiales bacterium]